MVKLSSRVTAGSVRGKYATLIVDALALAQAEVTSLEEKGPGRKTQKDIELFKCKRRRATLQGTVVVVPQSRKIELLLVECLLVYITQQNNKPS